ACASRTTNGERTRQGSGAGRGLYEPDFARLRKKGADRKDTVQDRRPAEPSDADTEGAGGVRTAQRALAERDRRHAGPVVRKRPESPGQRHACDRGTPRRQTRSEGSLSVATASAGR